MEPPTVTDLDRRLDWALDDDERRMASSALEDASDLAREYGRDWTTERVPRLVRTLVLAACVRYLRNADGYTQSRAGDETLAWEGQGGAAGTVHFTEPEIALLRGLGGKRPGAAVPVDGDAAGAGRHPQAGQGVVVAVGRSGGTVQGAGARRGDAGPVLAAGTHIGLTALTQIGSFRSHYNWSPGTQTFSPPQCRS